MKFTRIPVNATKFFSSVNNFALNELLTILLEKRKKKFYKTRLTLYTGCFTLYAARRVNWEILTCTSGCNEEQQKARGVHSHDKYHRGRQISHKIGVLAACSATRTTPVLSHLIPFVTHLFSRVSPEILTYAGHYPTYCTHHVTVPAE